MRHDTLFRGFVLLAIAVAGCQPAADAPIHPNPETATEVGAVDFAPGEALARLVDGCCLAELETDPDILDFAVEDDVVHLRVATGQEEAVVRRLQGEPGVAWAQLDYLRHATETANDPRFGEQWALQRIQVQSAWDYTTGDPSVVVAVIDTGVDLEHPDLADRLMEGFNFLEPGSPPQDDLGHGTHAAGTIAATMNNNIGVAGVAPGVSIMPLKALNRRGVGRDSTVARAIHYAVDHGAWVINMSFGGKEESPVLDEAVAYAAAFGAVLVVAAGNEGRSAPSYPAATLPAISVAATSVDDARPAFSNYGNWIQLAAPGQSIVSTFWDARSGSTYQSISGTSMAAPHVSGVVALMFSLRPSLTVKEVGDVLSATVDPISSSGVGAGRLNAARAVAAVSGQGPLSPEQLQVTPTAIPLPTAAPAPTSAPTAAPPAATREPTPRPPAPPTVRPPQAPPLNQPAAPPAFGTSIPFPQIPTAAPRR